MFLVTVFGFEGVGPFSTFLLVFKRVSPENTKKSPAPLVAPAAAPLLPAGGHRPLADGDFERAGLGGFERQHRALQRRRLGATGHRARGVGFFGVQGAPWLGPCGAGEE